MGDTLVCGRHTIVECAETAGYQPTIVHDISGLDYYNNSLCLNLQTSSRLRLVAKPILLWHAKDPLEKANLAFPRRFLSLSQLAFRLLQDLRRGQRGRQHVLQWHGCRYCSRAQRSTCLNILQLFCLYPLLYAYLAAWFSSVEL